MKRTELIQLDQHYAQPPAAVWRALTTPELHARWWAAGDVRPVVGHRFELDLGQWGKQPCEVLEVEPERLFKYRFTPDWTLTWKLQPEGSGTRLTLIHDGFDPDNPKHRFAFDNMRKGWPGVLARLGATVADRLAS